MTLGAIPCQPRIDFSAGWPIFAPQRWLACAMWLQLSEDRDKFRRNTKTRSPDMSSLQARVNALTPARLGGIRRGVEKASLRALRAGGLALTAQPRALGSALTLPSITTDSGESQ